LNRLSRRCDRVAVAVVVVVVVAVVVVFPRIRTEGTAAPLQTPRQLGSPFSLSLSLINLLLIYQSTSTNSVPLVDVNIKLMIWMIEVTVRVGQ